MKCLIFLLIFAAKLEFIYTNICGDCHPEKVAPCIGKCSGCRYKSSDGETVYSNITTEEQCWHLLAESLVLSCVEWRNYLNVENPSQCRSSQYCTDQSTEKTEENKVIYQKSLCSGCGPPNTPANGSVNFTLTTVQSLALYSCNAGFLLTGSSNTTCESSGNWSELTPTCIIIDCRAPSNLVNGSVNYITTTFNSKATYSCNAGHFLNGSDHTTCQDNGNWSVSPPSCTFIDCGAPSHPVNGSVSYTTTFFNSHARYSCNAGHFMNGIDFTTCQVNGNWSESTPSCTFVDCGAPNHPINGSVNFTTTFFNSQATYSCGTGYFINGSDYITCQVNGNWSGSTPSCTIIDCGAPNDPVNGKVIYTMTVFYSQATYSCSTGYVLNGSDYTTTCQDNGNWSDATSTCTIIDCGEPIQPVNGSVSYTTTTLNSLATYSCDAGHFLNGSDNTTCQENGHWRESTPSCTFIDCSAPDHPTNGSVNYTTTFFNSQATYSCNTGHFLNGSNYTTCKVNGNWSESPPSCRFIDCDAPSYPVNGSVNYTTTFLNSQATYSCNAGHFLNGSDYTTCKVNGNWSYSTPTCTFIDCGAPSHPDNGSVNFTTTTFDSQATYSCRTGYFFNGTDETKCQNNGNWSVATPTCTKADCGQPTSPANGTVKYTATTFNSTATYYCNEGFIITGSVNTTCGSDGNWSSLTPYCNVTDCGVPQQTANGTVYFNNTLFGSQAVYECNLGFRLSGQRTRTCEENGMEWLPSSVPKCVAKGKETTKAKKPLYIMPCLCYPNKTFTKMTQDQILAYLQNATSIDTKNTSAALDKLRSRSDSRMSSAVIGTVGIVILSTLGGLIVCLDLITICRKRKSKVRPSK